MDWKYKHFHQQRVFQAERDEVIEAARKYVADTLGWTSRETPDGFVAEGYSFAHAAIATFHFQSAGAGTKVDVELLMKRAGSMGFMLFDVGGYYNIQIRKWLDDIQWTIHQKLAGADQQIAPPSPVAIKTAGSRIFNGCILFIVAMFALWIIVTAICAIVGLLTGTLYLVGRGGTLVLHGLAARIVSVLILAFGLFIAWRVRHVQHRSRAR